MPCPIQTFFFSIVLFALYLDSFHFRRSISSDLDRPPVVFYKKTNLIVGKSRWTHSLLMRSKFSVGIAVENPGDLVLRHNRNNITIVP